MPGSKVGICGRTGSGKSSLIFALLCLNVFVGDEICIDPNDSLLDMDLVDNSVDVGVWDARRDVQLYVYSSKDVKGSTHFSGPKAITTERWLGQS